LAEHSERVSGIAIFNGQFGWELTFENFRKAGLTTTTYRYLTKAMTLDIDGMLADLNSAPKVLARVCIYVCIRKYIYISI